MPFFNSCNWFSKASGGITTGFALMGVTLGSSTLAAPSIFALEQIKTGLEGYALTAGAGNVIAKFPVRVEALVQQTGDSPRILVRASGAFIEASGGIAAGMSGSPVYFKGANNQDLLAGAISAGFPNADHKLGLVTPIELMLRALPGATTAKVANVGSSDHPVVRNPDVFKIASLDNGFSQLLERFGVPSLASRFTGTRLAGLRAVPLATPLQLGGFSGRAAQALLEELRARGANVTAGVGANAAHSDPGLFSQTSAAQVGPVPARPYALGPGAPISVQLVGGDLLVGAVGTVTFFDGKNLLAFGHEMLGDARGRYLAAPAFVNAIIPASDVPFKLAENINKPFGLITTDKPYGIGGTLMGEIPSLPFEIGLRSTPSSGLRTIKLNLAPVEALTSPLVFASVLSSLDAALEGAQAGSATINLTYGFVDRAVTFQDRVADETDIARFVAQRVASAVALLTENPFQAPALARLKLSLELGAYNQMRIVKAEPETRQVKAGQSVVINLRLQPWREAALVRRIVFKVPNDASPGELRLSVRGGQTPRPNNNSNDPFEGLLGFGDLLERLRNRISGENIFVETNDEEPSILAIDAQNAPVAGLVSFKLDVVKP